jgi:hypothetical protein
LASEEGSGNATNDTDTHWLYIAVGGGGALIIIIIIVVIAVVRCRSGSRSSKSSENVFTLDDRGCDAPPEDSFVGDTLETRTCDQALGYTMESVVDVTGLVDDFL